MLSELVVLSDTGTSTATANYCTDRIESTIDCIDELISAYGYSTYVQRFQTLRSRLSQMLLAWRHTSISIRRCSVAAVGDGSAVEVHHASGRGRPKIYINVDQVELLRSGGYTWDEIADCFLVSRATIWRRLREAGVVASKYSDISDRELDNIVGSLRRRHPHSGQNMIQGMLTGMGHFLQRYRIRESLQRIDPLSCLLRRHQPISRRKYSVPGPNSLWHIDGHHSLVRWGFVIHGGVDGFSRLIVYLYCSTNNRADTVLELFRRATTLFGVPSRVRSDRGGENVSVCEFMISYRGVDRASHIAGSSVHNQRIERMWRDVFRCVCSTFYSFYSLEESGYIDLGNNCDLYALQAIYTPRINQCLREFACGWNHHPLRTEHHWSPKKIWMNGMVDPDNRDLTAVRDVIDPLPADVTGFGIDPSGPLPLDLSEGLEAVVVEDLECPLNGDDVDEFNDLFDPLCMCDDYGVALYLAARQFVRDRSGS